LFSNFGEEFEIDAVDLSPGAQDKVLMKCDYCNDVKNVVWRDVYKLGNIEDYACKHCKMKRTSIRSQKERSKELYDRALTSCEKLNLILLSDVEDILNSDSRVKYKCPTHGINETKVYTLILGHGCPKCQYDNFRLDKDYVFEAFKTCGVTLLNKDNYIDTTTKNLKAICPECGEIFLTSYNSFISVKIHRCPKCSKSESIGEYIIKNFLENNNIKFIREFTFKDCKDKKVLPFDFYLPTYNLIIEFDGEQHYKCKYYFGAKNPEELFNKQKKHDKIKTDYCIVNNINILRIPYWEINNIEKIIEERLQTLNLHDDIV